MNLGVKALVGWVNSFNLEPGEIKIEALQDGKVLYQVIHILKKESSLPPCRSSEEQFQFIIDFVEKDCRFNPHKGTSISWDSISCGINPTVEIAKVLLLLVYYDLMNDRATLSALEYGVEQEIAKLTTSFVMESDDCVYLSSGLDAYLTKKYLPVPSDVFGESSTASSSVSTFSSLSDEDSPVLRRRQKITFVDMETVASSSVRKSPLQDIMNTPRFQMRKMQRQVMKEREYRDSLEQELAAKIAVLTQRESYINQMQYRLDKLREEQEDREQIAKEQIDQLETKNEAIQLRLNEILKESKDWKSNSSLMERKIDELSEENGVLASQMRLTCSQLAAFEAEVARLTETQALAQEEWRTRTERLQAELSDATAEKELLGEQIQILQGKLSCLEEEIKRGNEEELGENMWSMMERQVLESDIIRLRSELDTLAGSLREAEADVQAKAERLAQCEEEVNQQKELLRQQGSRQEDLIRAKDEVLERLQREVAEQKALHQLEVADLRLQHEQIHRQMSEEMAGLREHIDTCEQETKSLKERRMELEGDLHLAKEKLHDLETKFSALTSLLDIKDQEIISLREDVNIFSDQTKKCKDEIQAKDEILAQLRSKETDQQDKIQTLTAQVDDLTSSLRHTEEDLQLQKDLLETRCQENIQLMEELKQQIEAQEEETKQLNAKISLKKEELDVLKSDSSERSQVLQEEIRELQSQVDDLQESLRKAEEKVQSQQAELQERERQTVRERDSLQGQLCASKDQVKLMEEEIKTKEEQITLLKVQYSEESSHRRQEIEGLEERVECLSSSLRNAEENLQSKEDLLTREQQLNTKTTESLRAEVAAWKDEVSRLGVEISMKEEQLGVVKKHSSAQQDILQREIEGLSVQVQSMKDSLQENTDQEQAREEQRAKHELEHTIQMDALRNCTLALEEEVKLLKVEIQTKTDQLATLKAETCEQSEEQKKETNALRERVEQLNGSLQSATEELREKEHLLAHKESEISREKEKLQEAMATSEETGRQLREEINSREEQLIRLREEAEGRSENLQQEIGLLKKKLEDAVVSLSKAEETVQTQADVLSKQEQESSHQKELFQQQLSNSEANVRRMSIEIRAKEDQITQLKAAGSEQSDLLHQDIQSLKSKVEILDSSLRKAEEEVQSKADLLAQQREEAAHSYQEKVQEVSSFKEEIRKLSESHQQKEELLLKAEEKLQSLQKELFTAKARTAEKDQSLKTLDEELTVRATLLQEAEEKAQSGMEMLAEIQEAGSKNAEALQQEIQSLKEQVGSLSLQLQAAEKQLADAQESAQRAHLLQERLDSANADLTKHLEAQAEALSQKLKEQELQAADAREKKALVLEKEALLAKVCQTEKDQHVLERQVEALVLERERLLQTQQVMERENVASRKLESVLQQELELLKQEKERLLKCPGKPEDGGRLQKDLQEKLSAKSEDAEHYKAQMEKAVCHYNDKKQRLQESQAEVAELKHSLDVKEREVTAVMMENKLLQLDLEKARDQEKALLSKVASLEAQFPLTNHQRASSRIPKGGVVSEPDDTRCLNAEQNNQVKRTLSSDSLNQSTLEDSLNITRKLSGPHESSTPLVRSSERLAAKRHASRETLYFTPINGRRVSRAFVDVDSARKNPTSSVSRRRTIQETPGAGERNETFYSLASTRSQPDLSGARRADSPTIGAADQLSGLPGYRQSRLLPASRPFTGRSENEPESTPEDWIRIAELQARNKACLPHLKSSYPVEFETGRSSAFIYTDEELRTGDPTETFRRASMMPGQLQDSLSAHCFSLAPPGSSRLSLMPGQLPHRASNCYQLRSPKRASVTLSVEQALPEKKMKSGCLPRPLTPKNRNVSSQPPSAQLQCALSPAQRRESMMFTIENTPKKNNYLKKSLNKLRGSARKTSKRSPINAARECQENTPSGNVRAGTGRATRGGCFKSPLVMAKQQRKSPQGARRAAKSPGLTGGARKIMKKMKV